MRIKLPILISLLASLTLAGIALWWAPLNQDEGWYLMAARRVSQGQMPYRDFAFTQAPLFPYVFQFSQGLIKHLGLLGGRLFNLFWAVLTWLILLKGLKYFCPGSRNAFAVLLLIVLLGLNIFQTQYLVTVKTYALAGFFLSLSALSWLSYQQTRRLKILTLCALALAAAAATRFSLGLFFVPLGCALMGTRKKIGDKAWIAFAVAGFAGLACFFGPFILLAPEGLKFGLLDFHAARQVDSPWLLKAGFLSRTVQSYFPALLIIFLLLFRWKSWQPGLRSLAAGIGAVTLLHLLAPFPYDDYQAALYPVLVLMIAIEGSHQLPVAKQLQAAPLITIAGLLFAFSSPQLPSWFSYGQDRIWWQTKPQSDLQLLQETAGKIRETKPQAKELLTTETYLAIESRLEIPRGMEMGPFSYFPDLDMEKAERLNVLNTERLLKTIRNSSAPVAAISGYSFTIESPYITPTPQNPLNTFYKTFEENYQIQAVIENFGQGHTSLYIALPRRTE